MNYEVTEALQIRAFDMDIDDIEALTDVLHKAYKQLADMGLRYLATHQNSTETRRRIQAGKCLIGLLNNQLVSTITYYRPGIKSDCKWYSKEGVGIFAQFGVLPELQGSGIGSRLLDVVEGMGRQDGCGELAMDTAEPAIHLHKYYEKRGYRIVEYANWESTNYPSVIMSKTL